MHRKLEVLEAKAQVEDCSDCLARVTSKEFAPIHSVKSGTFQNALFHKTKSGCRFGGKCFCAHHQVDEQPSKMSKKNDDKCAVAILKSTRQLDCVFHDIEPPKSSSILRKSSDMRKLIRCVQFTQAVVFYAHIRDKNPSFGIIFPGELHQRSPNTPKFEDRSQEET